MIERVLRMTTHRLPDGSTEFVWALGEGPEQRLVRPTIEEGAQIVRASRAAYLKERAA
jgi:hypothetical protein